jgi:carboxyl-terminal processing protease
MRDESPIDGLVIDLRGNGGGSLDEANSLTGLFINEGPTVQIRSANDRVQVMTDPDPSLVYGGPLMVLVDRLSASASEIFAGAIQDYDRGIVMGSQTFGKGTVQSVRPLNHGQLKITQAKFYRISGASTQNKGVMPDILIPDTVDNSKVGEDALDNALPWDAIASAEYTNATSMSNPDLEKELERRHQERFAQEPEYQILIEEIALLDEQRQRTKVSLNKKERMQENDFYEAAQLALENKRRKLDQLKPFKTIEEWDEFIEASQSESDPDENKEPDFIVEESAEVLLDFIELSAQKVAKAV